MLKQLIFFPLLLITSFSSNSYSSVEEKQYLGINISSMLTGQAVDVSSDKAQFFYNYDDYIDYQYKLSSDENSLFFGVGFGVQNKHFDYYPEPTLESGGRHNLESTYLFVRLGYTFKLRKIYIKPNLRFLYGKYSINGPVFEIENESFYSSNFNVLFEIPIIGNKVKVQIGPEISFSKYQDSNNTNSIIESVEFEKNLSLVAGVGYTF